MPLISATLPVSYCKIMLHKISLLFHPHSKSSSWAQDSPELSEGKWSYRWNSSWPEVPSTHTHSGTSGSRPMGAAQRIMYCPIQLTSFCMISAASALSVTIDRTQSGKLCIEDRQGAQCSYKLPDDDCPVTETGCQMRSNLLLALGRLAVKLRSQELFTGS